MRSRGCPLSNFLTELLSEFEAVLRSRLDDNPGGPTLEAVFDGAWVRFTHFAQAGGGRSDELSMASTEMAWLVMFYCTRKRVNLEECSMSIILVSPIGIAYKTKKSSMETWSNFSLVILPSIDL
ncbi:hypothetical protein FRB93_003039 [Tulasnella sp. JGI-2019a]|nr:hypothetical protein FRB93_003039 [Tulasnella sp. JGI-2019a]